MCTHFNFFLNLLSKILYEEYSIEYGYKEHYRIYYMRNTYKKHYMKNMDRKLKFLYTYSISDST